MQFSEFSFPFFLFATLFVYHCAPKLRKFSLLLASYFFYACWDWRFCLLIAASTCIDFYCGRKVFENLNSKKGSIFLTISIIANLGILGFFKYYNFFVESFAVMLTGLGLSPSIWTLSIILPVGISFYTFQTMSYTIDISKGKLKPTQDFLTFALFVSFFPQLVAGPIEKARNLLPQLERYTPLNSKLLWEGALLLTLGYVKKVVLSDQIAPTADHAFSHWDSLASIYLWEGIFIFSLQIYFDFSGYSDIARGIAKWFGINLMVNFRQPYLSSSITEFWTRWHISLSQWLKEYLYIPLGGNRLGKVKQYRNLMLTMLLGGLWHGASFTFLVWGLIHGAYLSVHKYFLSFPKSLLIIDPIIKRITGIAFTFFLVLLTWVFFRAPSIDIAFGYIERMFSFDGSFDTHVLISVCLLTGVLMLIDLPLMSSKDGILLKRTPKHWRALYLAVGCMTILCFGIQNSYTRPFIYFQF